MQPNYIEQMNQKRQTAAQTAKEQSELSAMLAELKKMQLASLMGSQGKSTVILTDQTDLGDKIKEMVTSFTAAVKSTDATSLSKEQIVELKQLHNELQKLQKTALADTSAMAKQHRELIDAIQALKLSTVVNVPDQPVPRVTVQERKIDFKPVIDAIREPRTDMTPPQPEEKIDLDCYKAQDIEDSGDMQYVGFVNPEGHWYIIENDVKNNRMRYVFGNSGYGEAFKQAATYQYRLLNEAIDAAS